MGYKNIHDKTQHIRAKMWVKPMMKEQNVHGLAGKEAVTSIRAISPGIFLAVIILKKKTILLLKVFSCFSLYVNVIFTYFYDFW